MYLFALTVCFYFASVESCELDDPNFMELWMNDIISLAAVGMKGWSALTGPWMYYNDLFAYERLMLQLIIHKLVDERLIPLYQDSEELTLLKKLIG